MAKKLSSERNMRDELLKSFWQTFPPIWHATRALTHHTAQELYGITAAQFHLLRRISEGTTSVSSLADCMHLSRPNISRSVDELVTMGLVERKTDDQDRRNIDLSLSQTGIILLTDMLEDIGSQMKERFSTLTEDEIELLDSAFVLLRKTLIPLEHKK